jgi:hypothetical protein
VGGIRICDARIAPLHLLHTRAENEQRYHATISMQRGGITPWRCATWEAEIECSLSDILSQKYQKPETQVKVRTGPGGDGSRCGAVMLSCRCLCVWLCVSHAAESGPGLHGPQNHPPNKREKAQTGGFINLSCHVRKIVHQPSLWRPRAPESGRCQGPVFLLAFALAGGHKKESAWCWCLVDLLDCLHDTYPLGPIRADLTQRLLLGCSC